MMFVVLGSLFAITGLGILAVQERRRSDMLAERMRGMEAWQKAATEALVALLAKHREISDVHEWVHPCTLGEILKADAGMVSLDDDGNIVFETRITEEP